LPRVLREIFTQLRNSDEPIKPQVSIAFYEVYNEKIFDTFNKAPGKYLKPLNIVEDLTGNIEIQDLIRIKVESCAEALIHLSRALKVFLLKL